MVNYNPSDSSIITIQKLDSLYEVKNNRYNVTKIYLDTMQSVSFVIDQSMIDKFFIVESIALIAIPVAIISIIFSLIRIKLNKNR